MSRVSKPLGAVITVLLCALAVPAYGAPSTTAQPDSRVDAGSAGQRLTPDEVKDLARLAPAQFARAQESLSRSSAAATFYRIVNDGSGRCLAIGSSSTDNGAHAIQWECLENSLGQIWYDDGDHIVNFNSGKCLAIGSSSTDNGAHAIQWECLDKSPGQVWYRSGSQIVNGHSGKYLAIGSSSTANGAHAIQWEATGSLGQSWYQWPVA
ncbi:RICIN domain-containing protein [Kitasatospora sp. NPDC059646]|uniref:RICIN domain-containing protein n=1 Tax=Kitasatospora sp. NPDC059646 TaxID=3346893 RepID=UPI0036C31AD5